MAGPHALIDTSQASVRIGSTPPARRSSRLEPEIELAADYGLLLDVLPGSVDPGPAADEMPMEDGGAARPTPETIARTRPPA